MDQKPLDTVGIHHAGGWWTPDFMTGPAAYLTRALGLKEHNGRARNHRVAVQAGGHIGIYPVILAECFERVYTFEPEWRNFACLARNAAAPNIFAMRAVLGNQRGGINMRIYPRSSGGHQVGDAGGPTPTIRIDDLQLDQCDALHIDVEGCEIPVLCGALETIERCQPLIVAEENKKLLGYGRRYGDIEKLLEPFGYRLVCRSGEDIVLEASP